VVQKFVLRFLEKHAGLVVDGSCTASMERRMVYWRVLFADAQVAGWAPGKTLQQLFTKAREQGTQDLEPMDTDSQGETANRNSLSEGVEFLSEFL